MLLRFLRINDPYRLLVVLLAIVLLSFPLLLYPQPMLLQELKLAVLGEALADPNQLYIQVIDDTAPLTAKVNEFGHWLWGRSTTAPRIIAAILIFFQAAFFSIVLINNKAYNESTYLPAFLFAVLCFYSFDLLSLSPELFATTFLLFSLNNIFKEIEFRIQREETVLSVGLYIGIASLFIFSYSVFLIGALVILIIFTRLSLRKALLLLMGYGLPHGIVMTLYFYDGQITNLIQNFYLPNLSVDTEALIAIRGFFTLALIPVVYFVFAIVMLNREARFTKYQSQILQVMLLWMVICLAEILVTKQRTPHSFYTFIPALSYLISHYLLLIRRKWLAETMLWVFIVGIVLISYLARNNKIQSVRYQALLPNATTPVKLEGKKILVLSNDLALYQNNTLAGSFLNWELAKPIFEAPDFYENVIGVESALRQNPADVIVDENDYLQKFFQRIPALGKQYKREGILYVRISN